jgi:hypothetical protein
MRTPSWHECTLASTVILLLCLVPTNAKIGAIAVFRRDEVDLHKYSAVLAAIEPFRLQLSEEIKKSLNPLSYIFHKIKGILLRGRELSEIYSNLACQL